MEKYLKKALKTLNLKFSEGAEIRTGKDIDFEIKEYHRLIAECEEQIAEFKEHIENANNSIINLEAIKRQILIEEYKDLNPGKTILKL